jgi:hypothetical protein
MAKDENDGQTETIRHLYTAWAKAVDANITRAVMVAAIIVITWVFLIMNTLLLQKIFYF